MLKQSDTLNQAALRRNKRTICDTCATARHSTFPSTQLCTVEADLNLKAGLGTGPGDSPLPYKIPACFMSSGTTFPFSSFHTRFERRPLTHVTGRFK